MQYIHMLPDVNHGMVQLKRPTHLPGPATLDGILHPIQAPPLGLCPKAAGHSGLRPAGAFLWPMSFYLDGQDGKKKMLIARCYHWSTRNAVHSHIYTSTQIDLYIYA